MSPSPTCPQVPHFLITIGIRPVGAVWATMGNLEDDRFTEDIVRSARKLGADLVMAWKNGTTDPATEQIMASFQDRMRRLMLWRKEQWPYEYEYWRSHRGL